MQETMRPSRRDWIKAATSTAFVARSSEAIAAESDPAKPWFFVQLSDPQLGHHDPNDGFEMETATFEFAVASTIRLKPDFVVITGDLVNVPGHKKQVAEYKRIVQKFPPSIPVYHLAGNHDVGDPAERAPLQFYRDTFGRDYFSFRHNNMAGFVLNSVLMRTDPARMPDVEQQFRWVDQELENATSARVAHKIIFQHHPFYAVDPDEMLDVSNVPLPVRRRYLDLFTKHKVRAVFTGHIHGNGEFQYQGIDLVTSGTVGGRPFYGSHFGIRPVIVYNDHLLHRFLPFGRIPLQVRYEAGREFEPYAPFYW